MYKIIHIISALIRQFLLPNPFSNFFSSQLYADLFNILLGGAILHVLAYIMTGIVYEKGSAPGLGSFLYLFNYCIITGIIIFITWLIHSFWIAIIICIVLYIIALIILSKLSNKMYNFWDYNIVLEGDLEWKWDQKNIMKSMQKYH